MNTERQKVTRTEADAMMPPGDRVHTFIQVGGNAIIGCDVNRSEVLAGADAGLVELAGEQATAIKHGLSWLDGKHWVFVATKPT